MQKQDEQGVLFGKYQVFAKLAVGGMAELYLAKQPGIGGFSKTVVLKCILPHLANDEDFVTMFLDEARVVAPLDHPNIVHIYEIGEASNNMYFIVMEYIRGQTLKAFRKKLFKENPTYKPYALSAGIISQVAAGLHYAHTAIDDDGQPLELIHRDISPTNLIISYNGTVKIVDFGVAKASNQQHKTSAGTIKGKYRYMSPEQIRGLELDARSDIFSLGIVLYEISTNRGLFARRSEMEVIDAVRSVRVMPPSQFRKDYPPELEYIVMKALAKNPNDRYQTMDEMRIDLENFMRNSNQYFGPPEIAELIQYLFSEEKTGDRSGLIHTPLSPSDIVRFSQIPPQQYGSYNHLSNVSNPSSQFYTPSNGYPNSSDHYSSIGSSSHNSGSGYFAQQNSPWRVASPQSGFSSVNQAQQMTPSSGQGAAPHPEAPDDATVPGVNLLTQGLESDSVVKELLGDSYEIDASERKKMHPLLLAGFIALFISLIGAGAALYFVYFVKKPIPKQVDPELLLGQKMRQIQALIREKKYLDAAALLKDFEKHDTKKKYQNWVELMKAKILVGPRLDLAKQLFQQKKVEASLEILHGLKKEAPNVAEIDSLLKQVEEAQTLLDRKKKAHSSRSSSVKKKFHHPKRKIRRKRRWRRYRHRTRKKPLKRKIKPTPQPRPQPTMPATGILYINSQPTGEVHIDGKMIGFTPINGLKIPVGSHRISIHQKGYKVASRTIVVAKGKHVIISEILKSNRPKPRPVPRLRPKPRPVVKLPTSSSPQPRLPFSAIRLPRKKRIRLFIADQRGIGGWQNTFAHRKLCRRIEKELKRIMGPAFPISGITKKWQRFVHRRARREGTSYATFYPRAVAYIIYRNLKRGRSRKRVSQLLVSYEYRHKFRRYINK